MARPKKDKNLRHTRHIMLRLTNTEYEIIAENAKAASLPLAEYVRNTVEADDCRVRVLALDVGSDTPYADTHRPDKHNRFRFIEKIASQLFERGDWFDVVICFSTIDDSFAWIFVPDFAC